MTEDKRNKEFTVQGADLPVPVRGMSGRAGSPGPSACDRFVLPVANQAGSGFKATGGEGYRKKGSGNKMDEIDPFRRRESLRRTPPRERSFSLGMSPAKSTDEVFYVEGEIKLPEATTEAGTVKRPREDSEDDLKELKKMFAKLRNVIKDLTQKVQQNTRVEIKKGIRIAKGQVDEIVRQWDGLTQSVKEGKKSKRMEEKEAKATKPITVDKRTLGTQVSDDMIDKEMGEAERIQVERIRQQLNKKDGWKGYESIIDLEWPEKVFTRTSWVSQTEDTMREDVDIAVILDPKIGVRGKALGKIRERFPDLEPLIAQEINDVEYIRKKVQTESSRGEGSARSSTLYVLPLETGGTGGETKGETEKMFELFQKVTTKISAEGKDTIKLVYHESIQEQYIRKSMEAALVGTEIQAGIFRNNVQNVGSKESKQEGKRKPAQKASTKMIIKMKGANYADTLKKVKEKTDPENLDVRITNIRSTARGDLLLEIGGVE